jgi:hypothetical protein
MAQRAQFRPNSFRPHLSQFQTSARTIEGIAAELAALFEFLDPTGFEAGTGRAGVSLTGTRHGLCGAYSLLIQIDDEGTIFAYLPPGLLMNAASPDQSLIGFSQLAAWRWEFSDESACESCMGVEGGWECSFANPAFSLDRNDICTPLISRHWNVKHEYGEIAVEVTKAFAVTQLCGEIAAPHSLSLTARFWSMDADDEGELVDLSACNYWEAR